MGVAVLSKVTEVDLHPDKVSNVEMGYLWLARRTDDLAFGRIDGWMSMDRLPARLHYDEGRETSKWWRSGLFEIASRNPAPGGRMMTSSRES